MRVRLTTLARERRKADSPRRTHAKPQREQAATPDRDIADAADDQFALRDERRARASGGPIDHAQYTCSCGYVFYASVSTSVACPHCGATQAW